MGRNPTSINIKKGNKMRLLITALALLLTFTAFTPEPTIKLGLLKYAGGGDWYANPTALPNLAAFCNSQMGTNLDVNYATVEVGSAELFNYPFYHMTGHGTFVFSDAEAENLRTYLLARFIIISLSLAMGFQKSISMMTSRRRDLD